MPYKKNKKYVPRRKKSYRKRFKDDKINTKIERKINQISKKNDAKNRELLVRATSYGSANTHQQSSQYSYSALSGNGYLGDTTNEGMDIVNLTAVGGSQYNAIQPKGTATETNVQYAKYFRFTKVQAFLEFYTESDWPCKVRVCLVYIPNASAYTAADSVSSGITTVLAPNKQICGINDMRKKGIFKMNALNSLTDYSNMRHTILASKTIKLLPPLSTGQPAAGSSPPVSGRRTKEVNLSYTFKGLGKRFVYNSSNTANARGAMSNGNIYITIVHNTENLHALPRVRGIAGAQYYLEKPSTQSWN